MDAERIRIINNRLNISTSTQELFVEIKGYTREALAEVERLEKEVLFWKELAESCECDQN